MGGTPRQALAATVRRLEALPPAIPLGLIMLAAAAATARYALDISTYFVMPDELGYVKQAVEVGRSLVPLTSSDLWFNSWAQLSPSVLAPAYALFDTPTAFDVAHVTNALVMASAAIPAYLLVRGLSVERRFAYLVAALTVSVPWLAMATTMLTEPAAYPVFVWAVLAIQRAVAAPAPRRDLLALLAIGLAFVARTQFVVLAAALFLAILIHEVAWADPAMDRPSRLLRGVRTALARHRVAWGTAAALVAAAVVISPDALLGSYHLVAASDLLPEGMYDASRELLAYVTVGIGALPLVGGAAWALISLARPESKERHAFAASLTVITVLMVLALGSFTANFTTGLNDRYLFFIAPLLFSGMVVGLLEGRRIAVPMLVSGAVVAWMLGNATFGLAGPTLVSPTATFQEVIGGRTVDLRDLLGMPTLGVPTVIAAVTAVGTVALAAASRWLRGPVVAAGAGLAVLAFCAVETGYTLQKVAGTQAGVGEEFLSGRDWIDRALPSGARAAALLGTVDEASTTAPSWWDAGFWNKDLDVLATAEPGNVYGQAFARPFSLEEETGSIDGVDDRAYLVRPVSDMRFAVADAQVVAERNRLELIRAPRPYRAAWMLLGVGHAGVLPDRETVRLRVYGDDPSGVTVVLEPLSAEPGRARYSFESEAGTRRGAVAAGETESVGIPLVRGDRGFAEAELTVSGAPGLRVLEIR